MIHATLSKDGSAAYRHQFMYFRMWPEAERLADPDAQVGMEYFYEYQCTAYDTLFVRTNNDPVCRGTAFSR
jgi:hypothetical protein